MGLFIITAIIIFVYLIFCSDGLFNYLKTMDEYNEKMQEYIKRGRINRDSLFQREYCESDLRTVLNGIGEFVLMNLLYDFLSGMAILILTFVLGIILPKNPYDYSFDINSLKDTTTIEGRIYGRRGYIEENVNYFFLRNYSYGEKMGHIPADKTYIRYSDEENPHIHVYKKKTCAPDWLYMLVPVSWFSADEVIRYELVVPNGSVIEDTYEIDME